MASQRRETKRDIIPEIAVRLTPPDAHGNVRLSINNSPFVVQCYLCRGIVLAQERLLRQKSRLGPTHNKAWNDWIDFKIARGAPHYERCAGILAHRSAPMVLAAVDRVFAEADERKRLIQEAFARTAQSLQALVAASGFSMQEIAAMNAEELEDFAEDLSDAMTELKTPLSQEEILESLRAYIASP